MRTIDLTPLYRSTIGFDRVASLLDAMASQNNGANAYPPYNIEKTGDTDYRITLAVAGFSEEDLSIESKDGELVIQGEKTSPASDASDPVDVLYRGIAERSFERRFKLADHVKAMGASLKNGLLHVELVREIPEALKPRRIAIASGAEEVRTLNA
ncbi:MAG: Hsp20 family protein [Rhodobacteraceae bacterium]|nr:Hsp20 family protein [Paracoccaceae bacterium]